jgi:hypothetical protein
MEEIVLATATVTLFQFWLWLWLVGRAGRRIRDLEKAVAELKSDIKSAGG